MLFNTFPFWLFLLIVFIAYWKLPQKHQWLYLLTASYYFFAAWFPAYLLLIIATTLVNYFCSLRIHSLKGKKIEFLILAIVFDLGALFVFKYVNFFSAIIGPKLALQWQLLLPLGISFYSFQTIGYMIDVYRGIVKPEKHLGYFALFVCFFPQMSAGPIERASDLLPQLKKTHAFQYEKAASGFKLFTFGLFKKMVIADNLAIVVNRVFDSLPSYKGLSLVIAVILYSWQLYTDFSGYTDMARGAARMLGIDLVENFNVPYMATSVRDFWRRWHMSLSQWFRDYLYIPLGGSRKGFAQTCINVLIVFTLCGLWHGAGWTFIAWGFFHGFVMVCERIGIKLTGGKMNIPKYVKIAYTYSIICISWVFFRANSLFDAIYILRYSFAGFRNFLSPHYIVATLSQMFRTNRTEMIITLGLFIAALTIDQISYRFPIGGLLRKQPAVIRYAAYIVLVFAIVQLRDANIQQFIYTKF